MTEFESRMERLKEYQEYKKRETRFKTKEEFQKFCDENHVYYQTGFGAYIQRLVRTDEEFIDFMLKCGVLEYGDGGFPWFVNDYQHDDEDSHLFFVDDLSNATEEQLEGIDGWSDEEGGFCGYMPNVHIPAYRADYNPYFEEPFAVVRDDEYKTYAPGTFRVNPKTSAKFPAIVRFVSMDDFDRMGSIKGESLDIISLADVADGRIMFL